MLIAPITKRRQYTWHSYKRIELKRYKIFLANRRLCTVDSSLFASAMNPKPSPTAPRNSAHVKRLLLHSCNSCSAGPHVVTICSTEDIRVIRLSCNGAFLPGCCLILGSSPYVPHDTIGPYHLAFNVRMRKLHTLQQRLADRMTHLMSSDSPIKKLLYNTAPRRTTTLELPGTLPPGRTHAPATCQSTLCVTLLLSPALRRQYFSIVPQTSRNFTYPSLRRPADHARPQPLPSGILPTAAPAFMASFVFTFWRPVDEEPSSPRRWRPCTRNAHLRL